MGRWEVHNVWPDQTSHGGTRLSCMFCKRTTARTACYVLPLEETPRVGVAVWRVPTHTPIHPTWRTINSCRRPPGNEKPISQSSHEGVPRGAHSHGRRESPQLGNRGTWIVARNGDGERSGRPNLGSRSLRPSAALTERLATCGSCRPCSRVAVRLVFREVR